MSYLTVLFFMVVVSLLFFDQIDCGSNYDYPHFIGVHVLSRNRNKREVNDDHAVDISTLCCNFTEPNDEKYEKYNKIFDICSDEVDSRPEFNYTIDYKDYDVENFTIDEVDGDFNFSAALDNIIYNYSSCIQECVFQKLEAINSDGNIIPDKVEEYITWLTPLTKDDLWRGLDQCGIIFPDSHRFLCNSGPMDYLDCIIDFSELVLDAATMTKMKLRRSNNIL
ncbi:hypothetical protein C0J52_04643 [Blattella germanica]|nr:hypothetical protein C0J52_04643 [Blattella germanica]